ncbi:hypothetical protein [Roseimaritima ulvae]|uniref:Uncharacterized protein n=1 Tax=Roseimaritima ulvae TaxID=980254 RepID=A0A5B9R5A1_9BACT|nr:hypothetical protein [Roseimaritima ulvae]QEG41393.1 hypothetical protein UC8_34140 [Roseimaritima ulvae]
MTCTWNGLYVGAVLPVALLFVAVLSGCEKVPIGGDIPVTRDRLEGTRLTDINRELSWTFSSEKVVISYEDQPLPADILEIFKLDPAATYDRLEASWELDESAGFLRLSQITADGAAIDHPLRLPITPAGPIRVTLLGRQYNMFAAAD